jgi:hypothetical protein
MQLPNVILTVCVAFSALMAQAQTTRPADQAWSATVNQFSKALAEGDATTTSKLLADPTKDCKEFGSDVLEDYAAILTAGQHGVVIGAHGYLHPAMTLVSDLVADVKASNVLSDDIKQRMTPQDADAARRAEATEVQWAEQTLSAKPGDAVGIIVLWVSKTASPTAIPTSEAPPKELMLVLLKGTKVHDQYRVSLAVYGNPLEQPR